MATNESTKTAAKSATKPEPAAPKDRDTKHADAAVEKDPVVSTCVVNGGRGMHVGNAVNGSVCSYHAMHYDSHGNRR